jgi:Putative Ig domain
VRRITKAALTLATTVGTAATLAALAAGPAAARPYPPPSIHLLCTAANGDALHGSVCALPPGQTTAPNNYSATIAVSKAGAAGATVTFALTAGSLPPGLTMPAQGGSGTVITGNPTRAGTFNFTVKATDGGLTATLAYQITVTVQGLPDQLLCTAANGSFLINGVCVLPDSVVGQPYQGHLPTSHNAGGTLSIVAGSLPPGLSLPSNFGPGGAIVSGTPTDPGIQPGRDFTVQGTGDQGQPLYQAYQINVNQHLPLTINASGGSTWGAPSFPDCGSFRIFSGKDKIKWLRNTRRSRRNSGKKRPVWWLSHPARSPVWLGNWESARRASVTGFGFTGRSTRRMSLRCNCRSGRGCGSWSARTANCE